jgi:hypothetical protein
LRGSRLATAPFDLNNDGKFGVEDMVSIDGQPQPVSGVQPEGGILPAPSVLLGADGTKEYKYNPGANGKIAVIVEDPGKPPAGRQSWRQIR